MRQMALDDCDQPSDEQSTADREREPGDDCEHEEQDPLRHGVVVGIGSDGYVLKGTFPSLDSGAWRVRRPRAGQGRPPFPPPGPPTHPTPPPPSSGPDPPRPPLS